METDCWWKISSVAAVDGGWMASRAGRTGQFPQDSASLPCAHLSCSSVGTKSDALHIGAVSDEIRCSVMRAQLSGSLPNWTVCWCWKFWGRGKSHRSVKPRARNNSTWSSSTLIGTRSDESVQYNTN
jgi:hypothetical protein